MAFPIVTPAEQIAQLYVGYFGRAADPAGLAYWVDRLNDGMSLLAIANSFAVQPEATSLYAYLAASSVGDPQSFIAAIYNDLFNRNPDAAGLAYWVDQLTLHGTPPGQMVLDIISGAQGADKTTIENKTHVAVDYAQSFHSMADAHTAVASITDHYAAVFASSSTTSLPIVLDPTAGMFIPGTGLVPWFGKVANVLKLTADDTTVELIGSHDNVVVLGVSGGAGVGETVLLTHEPGTVMGVTIVHLGAVEGPTAVFNTTGTQPLSIIGGVGATDTLFGGSAADTITANGAGPGFGSNFIWGGFGGDTETGVAGGAAGNVGTVFLINDRAESPGSAPGDVKGINAHITNFHTATDTVLVNPEALALKDVPTFAGTGADYGQALALLAGGGAAQTQAVYQADAHALWIDADNNGLLNAHDIRVLVDIIGWGFQDGANSFGNLLGLSNGQQATAYIAAKLAPITGSLDADATIDLTGVQWNKGPSSFP
jgi:hypothetical protein